MGGGYRVGVGGCHRRVSRGWYRIGLGRLYRVMSSGCYRLINNYFQRYRSRLGGYATMSGCSFPTCSVITFYITTFAFLLPNYLCLTMFEVNYT